MKPRPLATALIAAGVTAAVILAPLPPALAEVSPPTPPPSAPLFSPYTIWPHCARITARGTECWTRDASKLGTSAYVDHFPAGQPGRAVWILRWRTR